MGFEFPVIRLGDHVEKIGSGATPRGGSNVYQNTGIALIRSQNVYNNVFSYGGLAFIGAEHAQQLQSVEVKEGDVLLNITGDSVARACQVPADVLPARVNQHVAIIRTRKECLDPRFLLYYLTSPQMQNYMLALAAAGGTRNALTKGMIENFYVPAPDIQEQREIAHILGTLDDKIELNRRMNATIEATARAIFKSWFVDFDPVHAKARGEQPYGMDAETAALFPNAFDDSELGPIPAGWGVNALDNSVEIISGGTPKTSVSEYWGGDIPWISVKDVPAEGDVFVISTEKNITAAGLTNSSANLLPVGTTIISARGTVGKLALAGVPMAMNQSCYGIRSIIRGSDYYAYFLLKSVVAELQKNTHGTVFDTITRKTFSGVRTLVPPESVIFAFERTVTPLLRQVRLNLYKSRTLSELRDMLLPKLISGEMNLPKHTMKEIQKTEI